MIVASDMRHPYDLPGLPHDSPGAGLASRPELPPLRRSPAVGTVLRPGHRAVGLCQADRMPHGHEVWAAGGAPVNPQESTAFDGWQCAPTDHVAHALRSSRRSTPDVYA